MFNAQHAAVNGDRRRESPAVPSGARGGCPYLARHSASKALAHLDDDLLARLALRPPSIEDIGLAPLLSR